MPKLMNKFLARRDNKERLLTFLVEEWKHASTLSLCNIKLHAIQGESCFRMSNPGSDRGVIVEGVPELYSEHEEVDTRMLLHASQAAQSAAVPTDIMNCTVDTDVFVLALWVSTLLTVRFIMYLMTENQSRLLHLKAMSSIREEHTA